MRKQAVITNVLVCFASTVALADSQPNPPVVDPIINEFVLAHTGTDSYEYIELWSGPLQDLSTSSIVVLEGDAASNPGQIDAIFTPGTTDGNGLWWTGYLATNTLEGDVTESQTILVVGYLSGASVGDDLDFDDNGTLDSAPWTSIYDDVAVDDGDAGDVFYSTTVLSEAMDGLAYSPGGASRIPNATDTNSVADWLRNDWSLAGINNNGATLDPEEAMNTPGTPNSDQPLPDTFGMVINEWVVDHDGADTAEFVEVFGTPLANASTATILAVSGDTGHLGEVDASFAVDTLNGGGYWATDPQVDVLSGSLTLLLVDGYSSDPDLDDDDDGALDEPYPWTELLDSVSVLDGDPNDVAYSASVLSLVGGASRIPNGADTDSADDWFSNDFAGEGLLPGVTGTASDGEALNTPSWPNRLSADELYAAVDDSTPTTLRATLHHAIDDHIRYNYTDSAWDVWNMVNDAEEYTAGGPGVGEILEIYRNEVYTKIEGGTAVYNREHSWPNTYGFSSNSSTPYTDGHHLFASYSNYNSDRSSRPFRTCDASCTPDITVETDGQGGGAVTYPGNHNWYDGATTGGAGRWETWIGRRGDVARALLYMDVRYDGTSNSLTGAAEPDLVLTDNLGLITSGSPNMGELSTLLQWHRDDPVDAREQRRNEVISSFQTNRNPFIDHPEWVACVFEGNCAIFSDGFETGSTSAWSATFPD